jgi:hypothetical protein
MARQDSREHAALSPESREFIERALVPALVDRFLRETRGEDHSTAGGRSPKRVPGQTKNE